ncbi:MAG: beta-galactosidase trimerization domain-containing protein [Lentisphaeria bacterium]|nr:beta-galactosidase trimerization domain-containing protein [Lentisphaeria bacterium]
MTSTLFVPFLAAVSLLCSGAAFATDGNLLANGSFEQSAKCGNEATLRARGFDLGPADRPFSWTKGWTVNSSSASGEVRLVEATDAPDGTRCLSVASADGTHIYGGGGEAGKRYAWEIWAKGRTLERGENRIRPEVSIIIYHYGVLDELTGKEGFLSSWRWKKLAVGPEWKRYSGILTTRNPGANRFTFVLGLAGSVLVDAVSLRLLNDSAPAQPALRRTFHLSFDQGADAAESSGNGKATIIGKLEFAEGKKGRALVCSGANHVEFDAPGNFDQNEGALALWVRPLSDADDGRAHCLVEVPVPPYNFLDSGFVITKGFTDQIAPGLLYFITAPPWAAVSPGASALWERDQWQHLLFTWSRKAGRLAVYCNGQLIAERRADFSERPATIARKLVIGARMGGVSPSPPESWDRKLGNKARDLPAAGGYSAEAVIDELQIFDRMVTDQEAWQLAGGTGPAPRTDLRSLDPAPIVSLPHDLITPHVPFAKPLLGGPIQTLFLIPQSIARDVVELWQRMEITYDAFLLGPHHRSPFGANAHARKYHKGLSDKDRKNTLLKQLAANPDVVVLAGADLRKAPREVRAKLLAMVRAGTGLVMTSRGIQGKPFSEREDAEGRAAICTGVPWSGLPELFADSATARSELPERAVHAYTCGKGRVVEVRFTEEPVKPVGYLNTEAGLTPCLYGIPYTREWDERYGRYLSLVGRAVRWAAGRSQTWQIRLPDDGMRIERDELPKENFLQLALSTTERGQGLLSVKLRDALGHVEFERVFPVTIEDPGASYAVNLACPLLKMGLHYLDAQLLVDGKTADWGSASFAVTGPEQIREVALRRDSVECGENVRGRVLFQEAVQAPGVLTIQAKDTLGRIHAKLRKPVAPGTRSMPFALLLDAPATLASYVEAILERDGEVVSEKAAVVFVPRRDLAALKADEFSSVGWLGFGPATGPGMVYARQVRAAGFNIGLRWPVNVALRNCAMWDFTPVAYSTRLLMNSDPKGWTKAPAGIEDGSFANPGVKEHEWRRVELRLGDTRKYGPLFYSLGDECHFYGEMGFSPWGRKAYRSHLRAKYRSISNLNREWGANYAAFDEVPRLTPGQAREQRHVPAMIDHRAAQERVWREMFVHLRRKILEYDPAASVGAEGSMTADMGRMLEVMDVWAPYANPRTDVLMRSLARPGQITGHWHGHYCGGDQRTEAGLTRLWEQLFRGFANTSFYFLTGVSGLNEGILMPDGSYTPFFQTQLPDLARIHNGVGQLLRACSPWRSGVMVHWSQASRLGLEAAGAFGTPQEVDGMLIQAFRALPAVGGHWAYVTSDQLADEGAAPGALLILPVSQCLSQAEVQALRRFVEGGGLLLGLGPVGTRNEFGRERAESPLGPLFGVRMRAPATTLSLAQSEVTFDWNGRDLALKWLRNTVNRGVTVDDGMLLAEANGMPIVVRKQSGRGEALLLNLNLARCDREQVERFLSAAVVAAGCTAPVRFLPPPGPGARWGMLKQGDLTLLGMILDHRPGHWNGGHIQLRSPQHVYNVKTGEYLGRRSKIGITGDPAAQSAVLFALQDAPVGTLTVRCPQVGTLGQKMSSEVILDAGRGVSADGRLIRVRLVGPDGVPRRHYQRMLFLDAEGRGQSSVGFALNDPAGLWTIEARDIASGTTARTEVDVAPPGLQKP